MNEVREQLTDYFKSELAELRSDALQFAHDYPRIAEELSFNGDKSRDPHIELLLQSFSWMTGRLRQNMEAEAKQLPSMLLQQLYPQLMTSVPSMAIMECEVHGSSADFDKGYRFEGSRLFEPSKIEAKPETANKLSNCRFSSCHSQLLWPLKVTSVGKFPVNQQEYVTNQFPRAQSIIDINIKSTPEDSNDGLMLNKPLRFFMNLDENSKFPFYDLMACHFIGAVVFDAEGNRVATLNKDNLKFAGFADHERSLPATKQQDLGLTLLLDYMSFPEKFLFFDLTGMEHIQFKQNLRIMLVLDNAIPKSIQLTNQSLKLNCIPVVNLFQKTSEPIPLTYKDYRYKLFPSREQYDCYEIYRINKVFSMNRRGESRELLPYFCLSRRDQLKTDYRWQAQIEASHKKQLPGSETYISLFNKDYARDCPQGETIYAQTLCCNRTIAEFFNTGQTFSVIGSSPIVKATMLTRPTRYRGVKANQQHLWKVLSHLSLYYVSLTDKELAQDTLTSILELYTSAENSVNQRQIESIESFTAHEDVYPVTKHGWRGYYQGVNFKLTLFDRKFDNASTILFGSVLNQFLALFCHINSFVRLEMFIGSKKVYEWKPLSGHKHLA